ncbi:MAG: ribonuclease H-like domain-containing protein [Candidatus Woesearchaeota archaeon]|nr:ribonuclease H-like domain-containing protein [Candidatus Woesearchaeota archaeon]
MIRNSFIFLPKISSQKEASLWKAGIKTWDDFLNAKRVPGIAGYKKVYFDRQLLKAKANLYSLNSVFFDEVLPRTEHWRLYEFFKDETCFLDIETTGLSNYSHLTLIGLYDGINTKTMINGINLDVNALKEEFKKYKLIVTFNGATFDLPFIKKRFPGLVPAIPHFDLRHACSKIGLKGGLKEIEKQLGIKRKNPIVEKFYGGDAAMLWRMFKATGDEYYLNLLVEYNEEDIINLKAIADHTYKRLKEKCMESINL